MDFLLQPIISFLLLFKYLALFLVSFLAALAIPLPSSSVLMASAAFASQGYFNLGAVIFFASIGNIAGDNVGYWLARVYGKPVLYKIGFRRVLDSSAFKKIESSARRQCFLFVFFTRFHVITTISGNIVAGLSRLPFRKFLIYESTGEIFQVLMYVAIGYFFGNNWQAIYDLLSQFNIILILFAVLVIIFAWIKIKRAMRKKREG